MPPCRGYKGGGRHGAARGLHGGCTGGCAHAARWGTVVKQDDTLVANTAPARSKWPQLWLKGANTRKGRLRRQVARAFIALGSPLTVTDILPRCYYDGKFSCGRRQKLRRALLRQAIPIGRQLHRRGRPLLWAPRPELAMRLAARA